MRLVDVQQGVVPLLDLDEPRQVGVVAVHAVDALDRHYDPPILPAQVPQQSVELDMVIVAERSLARLRGGGPLHDAVVRQLVVEDQVARAEQVVEHRCVGAVAAGKHHGPLGADKVGQRGVEFVEDRVVAAHHAAGRRAAAEAIDGLLGRPRHVRMTRQAQIVEACETDHIAAGDRGGPPTHPLVGQQEGIVEPGLHQPVEAVLESLTLGKRSGVDRHVTGHARP